MTASIRLDPTVCPIPEATTAAAKAYADPTGAFSAGIWRSKPNRMEVRYTKDEFCLLLEGEVRLTDASGKTETYRAGDAFVVPAGFSGTWDMPVPVTKYYVLHVPKV